MSIYQLANESAISLTSFSVDKKTPDYIITSGTAITNLPITSL